MRRLGAQLRPRGRAARRAARFGSARWSSRRARRLVVGAGGRPAASASAASPADLAGRGQVDGRLVLVGLACGRRPRPCPGGASPSAPRAWRTPRGACPSRAGRASASSIVPGGRVDRAAVAGLDQQRQQPAVVEVGVGQQDGVELARARRRTGSRLRIDSFGLPWNIPQSMRTRARSVIEQELRAGDGRRAAEEVDLHARMVTARRASAAYPPRRMDIDGRRSGRSRSCWPPSATWSSRGRAARPPTPAGGSTRALVAPLPARGGARSTRRSTRSPSPAGRRRRTARALANMRGDARLARRARADARARGRRAGGAADEDPAIGARCGPRSTGATATRPRRSGSAARRLDRLTVLGRLAHRARPGRAPRAVRGARRRSGGRSMATAATASPYRRLLRVERRRAGRRTARRSRRTRARSGCRPGRSRRRSARSSPRGGRSSGPERLEPWDYWYVGRGGRAAARSRWCPRTGCSTLNRRLPGGARRGPGRARDPLRRPAAAGRPPIPVAFTIGMGAGRPTSRRPAVDAAAAVGLRDVRGGRPRQPRSSCSTRAATRSTAPAVRTRPAFLEWPGRRAPRSSRARPTSSAGTSTEPAWQRHWLGEAATPREALLDRYGAVMLDVCWALFEIELHRHPERRPNDVWTEITADGLGIEPHPEWSWWAIRGQLIDAPGLPGELRAVGDHGGRRPGADPRGPRAVVRRATRAGTASCRSGCSRPGRRARRRTCSETFLGGPLTAEPLLADLRRGG